MSVLLKNSSFIALCARHRLSGNRWMSTDDEDFRIRKAEQEEKIKQFRRSRQYSEQYTNLKSDAPNFIDNARKLMSHVKPLNFLRATPWTLDNIQAYIGRTRRRYEISSQRFDEVRYSTLGYDIGAAHFVVYRRGAVKFYGKDWMRWTTEAKYTDVAGLPSTNTDGYVVEAIDLSNVDVYYEGLQNLTPLRKLKHLNLSGSKLVDEWFLDAISNFSELQSLGLGNCPNVTHRGIASLHKLSNLQRLDLKNDKQEPSGEMKLAVLNLLDYKPDLKVDIDPTLESLEADVKVSAQNKA